MKLCFNEGTSYLCKDYDMVKELEICEEAGFDYIDLRFDTLKKYMEDHSPKELRAWFDCHRLKPFTYSAFCFFNWKKSENEKEAVFDDMADIIECCDIIGIKYVALVPTVGIQEHASIEEIKKDAVYMINKLADMCESHDINLSLEFLGQPACTINRFEQAYDIVKAVNRKSVGLALDNFHFYAMGSNYCDLEKADGKLITNYHVNDAENLPIGAPYNTDEKRMWPGDGYLDLKKTTDILKKIGCCIDIATIEVFRPEYYKLSLEENIKTAYLKLNKFVERYF